MKRSAPPKTVSDYLARVPEPARSNLEKVRAIIRSVAPPEATEVISYRIPMFKYKGMLVGFRRLFGPLQFVSGRVAGGL
jgi:uncharacterized protein YdhG (YjbR/CyaY superfamily)